MRPLRILPTVLTLMAPLAILPAQQSPAAKASLVEADRAAARAGFQRGIQAGWQEVLADDAVLLLEGAPLIAGRGRVSQALASQPSLSPIRIQRLPLILSISEDGMHGATSGASIIHRSGHAPDSAAGLGHYIIVWRRSGEGAPWQVVALLENGLLGKTPFAMPAGLERGTVPLIAGPARQMADADLAFARMAADSGAPAAFGNYAAPNATTPPGNGEIGVGAQAIRTRMTASTGKESVWAWHPVYAGASPAGDFGWTAGEATIKSSGAADASVYQGKYLTIWQRQPDGSIRFIMDSGNQR